MNIVYAAEKPSIAGILSDHLKEDVSPRDIEVSANPDETGSFLIRWNLASFVMSPSGDLAADDLED